MASGIGKKGQGINYGFTGKGRNAWCTVPSVSPFSRCNTTLSFQAPSPEKRSLNV